MISRRSVRIKVIQTLYSQILADNKDFKSLYTIFNEDIEKVIELNICVLHYLKEIMNYAKFHHQIQHDKRLISAAEKVVPLQILESDFVKYLNENEELNKYFGRYKTKNYLDSEMIKSFYFEMIGLREYTAYNELPSTENLYQLLNVFFKRIFFKSEDLKTHLEFYYVNIEEDMDLIHFSLKRDLKKQIDSDMPFRISLGFKEWRKESPFAEDLIKVVLAHYESFMDLIKPKLVGWDAERIPLLDILMIKMAMAEMLHFESIPLKVTMNEYIDLTKIFCSQKSKLFVNGILDRLMKDFIAEGKIHKTGRGLDL
jgi:N utilization substance protein B